MKAILEFNLDEELQDFHIASHAKDFYFVLYDLDQWIRHQLKHRNLTSDEFTMLEQVEKELHELMEARNICLNMLE